MGGCFSSIQVRNSSESPPQSAKVVTANGDLHEYNLPITVFQVLDAETFSSPSCFLCNSDRLCYDEYIPRLDSDEELEANQIYFVLPTSKLDRKLGASDMAALAVKANSAIQKSGKNRKKAKISPVLISNRRASSEIVTGESKKKFEDSKPSIGVSRSGSVRRLRRYTSKRAKLAVSSFRIRLSTIYEGTLL